MAPTAARWCAIATAHCSRASSPAVHAAEATRDLKPFHIAIRDPKTGAWQHQSLDRFPIYLKEAKAIAEEARRKEPSLHYYQAIRAQRSIYAQTAPIGPAGSSSSPSAETPHTYFGWVMRVDLDGFSARVEDCYDNNDELMALGKQFMDLMDAAADFVENHNESLAQMPWAGDNFTAAAVFATKTEYDAAAPKRLVELSLDFEKEMRADARASGFGGWAHGIAGGTVQWNSVGNVYVAGIEVNGRRYLVGAGEGFGRSTQAFGDINPQAGEIVLYNKDWERLTRDYQEAFKPARTVRGEQSSLYRITKADQVRRTREDWATKAKSISFVAPMGEPREIQVRPHYR